MTAMLRIYHLCFLTSRFPLSAPNLLPTERVSIEPKMLLTKLLFTLAACVLATQGFVLPRQNNYGQQNQSLVTWDEHSIMIRGERLFLFSGEFHPFRLPVPGLWLDVFQKMYVQSVMLIGEDSIDHRVFVAKLWALTAYLSTQTGVYKRVLAVES